MSDDLLKPTEVIKRIADVSETIAAQAGIGGMETAGQIVSFLAAHPDRIEAFITGRETIFDWGLDWFERGRLTWHAQNGKIIHPSEVRLRRKVKAMEKGQAL